MVAEEFFSLLSEFKVSSYVGVEDFADKMNFMFSVVLIILSMMVVTVKSYFFKPLSCYIATTPSGSGFDNYIENYCWVHGTIPILPGENIPQKTNEWAEWDANKRITYYQWVPFILGLQCIMFYTPKIIWQIICYNKIGTNLENLVNGAEEASKSPPEDRKALLDRISRTIEDMLYQHRDYRQGKIANTRRALYSRCNFLVFSKHLGTWLVLSYFFIKVLYGINVIGQLYLMKSFLGFDNSLTYFGYTILENMLNGKEWHQTGIFPRVSYCYNADIRHLGSTNAYVSQCTLPINMLNEKIYVFLWFWVLLVGIITLISIISWLIKMVFLSKRSSFIKKLLKMHQSYKRTDQLLVNQFIKEYLRHDGVFLIRMICINAGDIVTAEILGTLWEIYKEKYIDSDFRNFNNYKKLNNSESNPDESCNNTLKNNSPDDFI
uniref:Innexin n=1 Tax=Dugesia japonica TaxID=6161 RepID=Q2L6M7_DUGJA|nr:innexin8 [Dugesia japonica]